MNKGSLLSFLLLVPLSASALDCMDSEYLVHGTFGVNPTATDLPPIIGLPGAESANLLQVQIQWLAMADRERQNEVITVNYPTETTTNVDVFDGETASIVTTDLRQAEIDSSAHFSRGQLNVNWCMPVGRTDGLIFAIYESGGDLVGLQGSPFAVFDGATSTAVLNQAITNQMGLEFNTSGADETREDIEAVTGMYPPRYLAEHIFQRDIPAMLLDELKNEALFHNPTDGIVVGNMFLVAGSSAGAYSPTSVTGVWRDGSYVLSTSKYVSDLDNKQGELSFEVAGERRPVFVVEGRAELFAEATDCSGGTSTITASFKRPSPLHSMIELRKGSTVIETATNDDLDVTVDCIGTYTVEGYRSVRGLVVDSETASFGLSETPAVSIDSFTASPTSIDTGQSTTLSWTVSNAASCAAEDGTSAWRAITPDAESGSADIQIDSEGSYTFTLSCSNGSDTDNASVGVSVSGSQTQAWNIEVKIYVHENGTPRVFATTYPSEEIIKRVWQTNTLEPYIGTREFICEDQPDLVVNTLDEVIHNYNTLLTYEQQEEFSGDRTGFEPFVDDSDNDGSSCDDDEPDNSFTYLIKLLVVDANAPAEISGLNSSKGYFSNVGGEIGPITLECDELFYGTFDDNIGTWTDNAAAWASVSSAGNLSGTPTGTDCGQTSTWTYTLDNGETTAEVDVTYQINAVSVQVEIYGVDLDKDGVADLLDDSPADGVFDSVINTSANAPYPLDIDLLISPDVPGNFNNGELPENMVFNQGNGNILFDPDPEQAGQVYNVRFQYVTSVTLSAWITLQVRVTN